MTPRVEDWQSWMKLLASQNTVGRSTPQSFQRGLIDTLINSKRFVLNRNAGRETLRAWTQRLQHGETGATSTPVKLTARLCVRIRP